MGEMSDWATEHAYNALFNLNHVFAGVYIWDYLKAVRFEWSLLKERHGQRSWTSICNAACRLTTLASMSLLLAMMSLTGPHHCQPLWVALGLFSSLAILTALLTIAHRITLIWRGKNTVRTTVAVAWLGTAGSLLYSLFRARSLWDYHQGMCTAQDTTCWRVPALILLLVDALFFGLLVAGCYALPSAAVMSYWLKLYYLGAIPFAGAALLQLAFTVLLFTDINDAINIMFRAPAVVMLSIAATRIYHVLEAHSKGQHGLSRVFVGTSFMSDPEIQFATNPAILRSPRSPKRSNSLDVVDRRRKTRERERELDREQSVSLEVLKETHSLALARTFRLSQSEADLSRLSS